MANTFRKIQTVTVGSGGAASIDFTSIPQTYTDLKIVMSLRSTGTGVSTRYAAVSFNSNTSNYTYRRLYGNGSSTGSDNGSLRIIGTIPGSTVTASVFGSIELYVPNYTSANNKSYSCDSVEENNATGAEQDLIAGLWSNTAAITSVTLTSDVGNFAEYSTATLYGISNVPVLEGAKATGGTITADNNYIYHTFLSSGTFTPTQSITCDYLVVAGGGGGGNDNAGGGGAGGLRSTVTATGGGGSLESQLALTATAYTVTVGAGGAGSTSASARGSVGTNSVFSTITSTGGGGGGSDTTPREGGTGGSGGGGASNNSNSPRNWAGGTGTANQGFAGGTGYGSTAGGFENHRGGGGGGAGAVGVAGNVTTTGGRGGAGVSVEITGSSVNYAGGGGGGTQSSTTVSTGGIGGGGNGGLTSGADPQTGTVNTGGGGGGGKSAGGAGAAGGSGIVIVRYAR
jgi:hypothetical protein